MSDMTQKGTKIVMINRKVCIFAGKMGAKEFAQLERYAKEGCTIAFMDTDKVLGKKLKEEFEKEYHVTAFFFHGDSESEEDMDLFQSAVQEMYGGIDYIVCNDRR